MPHTAIRRGRNSCSTHTSEEEWHQLTFSGRWCQPQDSRRRPSFLALSDLRPSRWCEYTEDHRCFLQPRSSGLVYLKQFLLPEEKLTSYFYTPRGASNHPNDTWCSTFEATWWIPSSMLSSNEYPVPTPWQFVVVMTLLAGWSDIYTCYLSETHWWGYSDGYKRLAGVTRDLFFSNCSFCSYI